MKNTNFKNKILIILFMVLTSILFSCDTNKNFKEAITEKVDDNEAQKWMYKIPTIGIEAYENIDKRYIDNLAENLTRHSLDIKEDIASSETDNKVLDAYSEDENTNDLKPNSKDIKANVEDINFNNKNKNDNENDKDLSINSEDIDDETEDTNSKIDYLKIDYNTTEPIVTHRIYLDKSYRFATFSQINDGYATLYVVNKRVVKNFKDKIVAVNAGHGTEGGTRKKTFSHPDYSPKLAGGTTSAGSIFSPAVSEGTIFLNNMQEATATLMVATALKDKLLDEGYSVLMIRENKNCRLDNIARTVIANEIADCHIAIHFDSTDKDKGAFYIKPLNNAIYRSMEPLKSNYDNIVKFGQCLIEGLRENGEKIWKNVGTLEGDLTQIAFSTNASVDIELGDKATVVDEARAKTFADGLLLGVKKFFEP